MSEGWKNGRNLILLIFAAATVSLVVFAITGDIKDLPNGKPPQQVDLFVVLAPFVAIATGIERFWEAIFGWYEGIALKTASLMEVTSQGANWAATELNNAQKAINDAVSALGVKFDKTNIDTFKAAELRLKEAQTRIEEALKSPEYKSLKQGITLLGSFAIGLGISIVGKLTLLRTAGFNVTVPVDIVFTGIIIGAGPGPLHAFIGWIQEFRNTLAGLADLTRGAALKKAAESLPKGQGSQSLRVEVDGESAVQPPALDALTHQRQIERLLSRV